MTIDEIRKYAEEKGYPEKLLEDMIARLKADYQDGNIDEVFSLCLCEYIDGRAEYWQRFREFLDKNRKEREKRREE